MPIDKESVPPPTVGKIGPYTVFIAPQACRAPLRYPPPSSFLPPVQPPTNHFDNPTADEDRSFWVFFNDAVNKAHCAHSSLDDHMARWLGLNQSKYLWALDDYY